jgi:ACS family hexuronate transporter-like MFS transporter
MGGMFGYLGAAAFTMVFGVLVTKVGYSPLFVVLAAFDLIAAVVVLSVARERVAAPAPQVPGTNGVAQGALPAA